MKLMSDLEHGGIVLWALSITIVVAQSSAQEC